MKLVFAAVLCLASASACAAPVTEHQALMDQIESNVVLPEDALPLNRYSRNYAYRPDGKIVAIYVTPSQPLVDKSESYGCEVVLENFESRPCTEGEIDEMKQRDLAMAARFGSADESRRFDDYLKLPGMDDGGCAQVKIIFDPRWRQIESVRCNGLA